MVGAGEFNRRAGGGPEEISGCVTNAEAWQFLRLSGSVAAIDRRRYYIDNVGGILAVFQAIFASALPPNQPTERNGLA
jgi:hypothetical protein